MYERNVLNSARIGRRSAMQSNLICVPTLAIVKARPADQNGGSAAERNEAIVGGFVNENRVLIPDVLLADVPRGVPRSGRDHGQRD
jgi:hypothetical protein